MANLATMPIFGKILKKIFVSTRDDCFETCYVESETLVLQSWWK